MPTKTYRCASCKINVTPYNWVRLTTGILLCQKCDIEGPVVIEQKVCTCHDRGTCKCLEISTRDGRATPHCRICGETDAHCQCGCTCEEA